MTSYSPGGYGVAINLRSSKTILVEGVTDKKVLSRLFLQQQLSTDRKIGCVIDDVSIINGAELPKGAKEKVQQIAASIGSNTKKFNWLVDGEWDHVDLDANDLKARDSQPSDWGLFTKGHSIENYWFRANILIDYLRMFFGDKLPAEYFQAVESKFSEFLRLGAAVSFVARRAACITRLQGVLCAHSIRMEEASFGLEDGLVPALTARGVSADFCNMVNLEVAKKGLGSASIEVLQWLCHGHLGEEVVRCCAARLAINHGATRELAEAIERGSRSEKFAHHSDKVAALEGKEIEPLWELVAWAGSSS